MDKDIKLVFLRYSSRNMQVGATGKYKISSVCLHPLSQIQEPVTDRDSRAVSESMDIWRTTYFPIEISIRMTASFAPPKFGTFGEVSKSTLGANTLGSIPWSGPLQAR